MAPLLCSSVSDLYGSNFGLSAEQIAQLTLKNNQECANKNREYQKYLKNNEVSGKPNFIEEYPNETFGKNNGSNTNISPKNLPPNSPAYTENYSESAKRLGYTNIKNTWPDNQGFSMFNRFQNIFGEKEYFASATDSDCLHSLVKLVKELLLITKIIMFILVLLFLIKILDKKN